MVPVVSTPRFSRVVGLQNCSLGVFIPAVQGIVISNIAYSFYDPTGVVYGLNQTTYTTFISRLLAIRGKYGGDLSSTFITSDFSQFDVLFDQSLTNTFQGTVPFASDQSIISSRPGDGVTIILCKGQAEGSSPPSLPAVQCILSGSIAVTPQPLVQPKAYGKGNLR